MKRIVLAHPRSSGLRLRRSGEFRDSPVGNSVADFEDDCAGVRVGGMSRTGLDSLGLMDLIALFGMISASFLPTFTMRVI